jgi:acyl CoA:acetate/3-ketoacid CoA transferase alpha subunit
VEQLSEILADSLIKRGFSTEEIPALINDLISLLRRTKNRTSAYFNQELENLGWGVQILDESLFQMIVSHLVSSDEFIRSMERKEVK